MVDWRDTQPTTGSSQPGTTGQVWFVTGASSGFGDAVARAALRAGHRVAATSRDPDSLVRLRAAATEGALLPLRLDLHDAESIRSAVAAAEAQFGGIDVLFNNAGTATVGAIEELSDDLLRQQLETNLIGPLALTRAVLPGMRSRGGGRLLQMSSMGGRAAFPGLGAYHASKFAFEGASIALAQEVAPFGVRVTLVEPGDFRTPVLSPGRLAFAEPMAEYADTAGQARNAIAGLDGSQPGDPERAADALLTVAAAENPPLQLALGPDCYDRLEAQLTAQLAELRAWGELSRSTDLVADATA